LKVTPVGNWETKVRRGFGTHVENYINQEDNAEANPHIQVFKSEEDEDIVETKYYCAICKKQIKYYNELQEWFCDTCGQHYDTKIQDTPVSNVGYRVRPHVDIMRYPTMDEDDTEIPYAKGVNLDEGSIGYTEEIELVKSSPDHRIKHIRVRGSLADALRVDM
jgi:hypothetical protein